MRYQQVHWRHDNQHEPVLLLSEIDDDGWELRKIEIYSSGQADWADASRATGSTRLGEVPTPPLSEINADAEFAGIELSAADFEQQWQAAQRPKGNT